MPTPCLPFTLTLRPVAAEGFRAYVLAPGGALQLEGIALNTANLKLEDGHLVIGLPNGGVLFVLEFTTSSTHACGTTLITPEGDTLRGTDVLQLLGQTLAEVGVVEALPISPSLI